MISDSFSQLKPVHFGHVNVSKAAVDGLIGENLKRLCTCTGGAGLIAFALKVFTGYALNTFFIIDKQNGFSFATIHWHASGDSKSEL
ncbi:MAG: hypothetical protein JRF29_12790 [Deltaproteobacteria bacterium]|nr:hypothetical protein [Deltaproteobacteria bacterium]